MAIKKITYDNKVGVIPKNIHVNEVWDDDMNEIKDAINTNADQVIQNANDIQNIISGSVVPDATATVKGKLKLIGDLGGTADYPTTPTALHKTGVEDVRGRKRFFSDYIESGGIDIYGSVLNGGTMLNISPGSGTNSLGISVNASSGAGGILVDLSSGARDAIFVHARSGSNAFVANGDSGFSGNLFLGTNSGFTTSSIDKLGNAIFSGNVIGATPTAANHLVTKAYADGLVVGLLDDRGSYNASLGTFPTTGGSGAGGAILKGDIWYVSVAGTIGGKAYAIGDSFRALIDSPAQISTNWAGLSSNIGYVPANDASVVHRTGNLSESVDGLKTFTAQTSFNAPINIPANVTTSSATRPTLGGVLGDLFLYSARSGADSVGVVIKTNLLTSTRSITFQDKNGAVAIDSDVLHTTGNDSFSGVKSFSNTSALPASISATNSSTALTAAISVVNSSATQYGLNMNNTAGSFGNINAIGGTTGNSINTSTTDGTALNAVSSGVGNSIVSNVSGTGLNYVGQNNGTNTFTVNKLGVGYFAGNVGIGTSPGSIGVGFGSINTNGANGSGIIFGQTGQVNNFIYTDSNGFNIETLDKPIKFNVLGERVRINTNGHILINTTTDNNIDTLQINGTTSGSPATLSNQYVTKSQLDAISLSGIKRYKALLSQTGTSAPTVVVLENSIGSIVWTRTGVGQYVGTLSGAFTIDKTWTSVSVNTSTGSAYQDLYMFSRTTANTVGFSKQKSDSTGTYTDVLGQAPILIEVYP